jgi:two-component system phosphate regulon sensor histidine kinase PhoR
MSVLRSRFFWKIYLTFSALILASAMLISWFVASKVEATLYNNLDHFGTNHLAFMEIIAKGVLENPKTIPEMAAKLSDLGRRTGSRINVIDATGKVLIDTYVAPEGLDDHSTRPEIQEALSHEYGRSVRFSNSTNQERMYQASAIRSGDTLLGFARFSMPLEQSRAAVSTLQSTLFLIALGGIFFALLAGGILARRVTVPVSEMVQVAESLRRGDYDAKVKTITKDEIGRLGDTLNRLGSELTSKITELQRLENVRRDFVANVSHEIKTPLTSIKGYIETLLSGADEDKETRHRFLLKIDRNASRLAALVQDILSLAKIEAAESAFKLNRVDLLPIITGVLARYDDVAAAKNIRMSFKSHSHHLTALGDHEAMIQVIDNLLTNAIKYTPEGGRISITVRNTDENLTVEVADTGIGIPEEHLERIFERFYRVDKARSREMGGTGLGLSIVKHLVSAMQGDIKVSSKYGSGSTFFVKLRTA